MGSALLDPNPLDTAFAEAPSDSPAAATQSHAAARGSARATSTEALRRQVAERLAEHRGHRGPQQPQTPRALSPASAHSAPTRADRIAATVAQRYAQSLSYRAYLAAEAERATQQARAASEIAALNAQAVARVQQQLLDSLTQDNLTLDEIDQGSSNRGPHAQGPNSLLLQHVTQDDTRIEPTLQLPLELSLWPESQPGPRAATKARNHSVRSSSPFAPPPAARQADRPTSHSAHTNPLPFVPFTPGLTIRLFEDTTGRTLHPSPAPSLAASSVIHQLPLEDRNDAEVRALDDEIAFRQSPVFEEPAGPPIPLPANLIEFPRQLVASRKARPRYAEGPLQATGGPAPADGQLRIFEVDPAQISTTPTSEATATAPQWTSLWLDAPGPGHPESGLADQLAHLPPDAGPDANPAVSATPLPQIASIARRLVSAAIDASIILGAFLASATTFLLAACRLIPWLPATSARLDLHINLAPDHSRGLARIAAHAASQIAAQLGLQSGQQPGLQPRLALAVVVLALAFLILLYQALFFTFSDATPGMRAARIALCTFDDENPTRTVLRRRILAILVSACPLGLGLLWAALDEDRLAWHDRITRTYQRSY